MTNSESKTQTQRGPQGLASEKDGHVVPSESLDPIQRSIEPPGDLPGDPARFWSAGANLDELAPPGEADRTPALKRLGPLPFPRGGFPLMGFLTTVYEHVASHVHLPTSSRSVEEQGE